MGLEHTIGVGQPADQAAERKAERDGHQGHQPELEQGIERQVPDGQGQEGDHRRVNDEGGVGMA